jgi:dynein intermediate chain
MDWSVKLWNPKVTTECIATFEGAEDYVYDVAWNPVNPLLFASVDGEGYIDLWDLLGDLEQPKVHYKATNAAINKARWDKDGLKYAIGDSDGVINVY